MTDFLFAQPNFLAGMGSAIDIGGTLVSYNISESPADADKLALANDWMVAGNSIRNAAQSLI